MLTRLEELYQDSGQSHLKPTADCYKAAIMAWAMSGEPEGGTRAIQLLDRMDQAHAKDPTAPYPRRSCYHYAMVAVGRSVDPTKAARCYELFQRMKEAVAQGNRYAQPNEGTYTVVLRSCTATAGSWEEKGAAFLVALQVLRHHQTEKPSEDVYLQFLQAAYRLLPADKERDRVLQEALHDCPEELLRSRRIQESLYKASSKQGAKTILSRINRNSVQHLFADPIIATN
jgi:hypothetical protein